MFRLKAEATDAETSEPIERVRGQISRDVTKQIGSEPAVLRHAESV